MNETIYIYPHENHVCNFDTVCCKVANVVERIPSKSTEFGMSSPSISVHITEEIYPDGSRKKVDSYVTYYDNPDLYEHTLVAAMENAEMVYTDIQVIKSFPRTEEPKGSYGSNYFDVIDLKLLSDQQLVMARKLAREFVGPQSLAVSNINMEMVRRFMDYASYDKE